MTWQKNAYRRNIDITKEGAVVYQIYPRSFKDSDRDGIGDIPGIILKLDYLKDLGVNVLWLCPVYKSPGEDNGYDISDYNDINPEFGTLSDMDRLIYEANKRNIKIIMDLVINHTSDQHPWFIKSKDKNSCYRDYYFWKEDNGSGRPNNWTGFFGGKAWDKDQETGDWYLHLFSKNQPDLNYHNPAVLEEIKKIMTFWLDKGIAGFRCDVINILWKESLENGRKKLILTGSEHYISQQGNHDILKTLRNEVLDHYDCFTVGETVFISPQTAREFCLPEKRELDMIFSFEHMETDQVIVKWFKTRFRPKKLFKVLIKWQNELPWNANYLENHDQPRSVSRFGNDKDFREESAKMLGMLLLTLRGTPFIYQGQELGMTGFDFKSPEDIRDVESRNIYRMAKHYHIPERIRWKMIQLTGRDNARTPFHWNKGKNAGFTEGIPWIKVNDNYTDINAEDQTHKPDSILSFYKKLIALRKDSVVLREGSFVPVSHNRTLFIYERRYEREAIRVLLNFSDKKCNVKSTGRILLSNYDRETFNGTLNPREGILLEMATI